MKESGLVHWNSPNTGATNESGFTGLPAGYRFFAAGNYYGMGGSGFFWSSSENLSYTVWYRALSSAGSGVGWFDEYKHYGFSIRCLQD